MQTLIRLDHEERLAELYGVAILDENLLNATGALGLDLVEDLHRLDEADDRVGRDVITHLDEWRRIRIGRGVVRPHHRAFDAVQTGMFIGGLLRSGGSAACWR